MNSLFVGIAPVEIPARPCRPSVAFLGSGKNFAPSTVISWYVKSDPNECVLNSSLRVRLMPWRGLNTSSRESAGKPSSRLRTLYGRVELICASDGAVMPTAELGLFGSLGLNGDAVELGSGFTTGAVGNT